VPNDDPVPQAALADYEQKNVASKRRWGNRQAFLEPDEGLEPTQPLYERGALPVELIRQYVAWLWW
jgi:hypothetical protein